MPSRLGNAALALLLSAAAAPQKGAPERRVDPRERPAGYEEILRRLGRTQKEIDEATKRMREAYPWLYVDYTQATASGSTEAARRAKFREQVERFQGAISQKSAKYDITPEKAGGVSMQSFHQPKKTLSDPDPVLLNDALYVDVQERDGSTAVTAWLGALRDASPERVDPAWGDAVRVETREQLEVLVAERDHGSTLVSRGGPLPSGWEERLKAAGVQHIRISERSPKRKLGEHIAAFRELARASDPARTSILSALPRAREGRDLADQVDDLGLRRDDVEGWRRYDELISLSEKRWGYEVRQATRKNVLQQFETGTDDTVILVAHSQYLNIRLPNGELITPEELADVRRDAAPSRTIVLVSCRTGTVNEGLRSIAETLIENKLATSVIAPPGLVSANALLRVLEALHARTPFTEVFNRPGWQVITQDVEERPSRVAKAGRGGRVCTPSS